jgi:hypothetical protein
VRRALAILAVSGACFGGAFAVGSATRQPDRHRAAKPAPVVVGRVAVTNLARAHVLPGLRAGAAPKRRAPVTTAAPSAVAQAPRRVVAVAPAHAPAPAPSGRAPAKTTPTDTKPAAAASGQPLTFFEDDGQ